MKYAFFLQMGKYRVYCVYIADFSASTMNSRNIIKLLVKDGWYEVNHVGSHKQFRHPSKKGRVTVPDPARDIPKGTLRSVEKQSGLKLI